VVSRSVDPVSLLRSSSVTPFDQPAQATRAKQILHDGCADLPRIQRVVHHEKVNQTPISGLYISTSAHVVLHTRFRNHGSGIQIRSQGGHRASSERTHRTRRKRTTCLGKARSDPKSKGMLYLRRIYCANAFRRLNFSTQGGHHIIQAGFQTRRRKYSRNE